MEPERSTVLGLIGERGLKVKSILGVNGERTIDGCHARPRSPNEKHSRVNNGDGGRRVLPPRSPETGVMGGRPFVCHEKSAWPYLFCRSARAAAPLLRTAAQIPTSSHSYYSFL